jgi:hypothetical protein
MTISKRKFLKYVAGSAAVGAGASYLGDLNEPNNYSIGPDEKLKCGEKYSLEINFDRGRLIVYTDRYTVEYELEEGENSIDIEGTEWQIFLDGDDREADLKAHLECE